MALNNTHAYAIIKHFLAIRALAKSQPNSLKAVDEATRFVWTLADPKSDAPGEYISRADHEGAISMEQSNTEYFEAEYKEEVAFIARLKTVVKSAPTRSLSTLRELENLLDEHTIRQAKHREGTPS